MDKSTDESMPISGIPEVTREHWQSDPVPSVLVERPIRASLVTAEPRASHLVQQAYLSDVVLAELTDIPIEDKHNVPVASLIDDVKRKQDLRKVMGKGNKFGHEGDEDDDNVIDGGTPTLPKELVNYRYSGRKGQMCQECVHFVEPAGCNLVIGMIRPVDTCDRFDLKSTPGGTFGQSWSIVAELVQTSESDLHRRRREREFFRKMQAKMEADGYECGYTEVSPPGWEGTVLRMKKHPEIDNPWALAHYMKNQGYAPHAGPRGGKKKEGGPGSGPRKDSASKFAPGSHDDEDPMSAMFTRRENPRQRRERIKRKPVDPETAAAIRRALMSNAVRESVMVYRAQARLVESEDEAGTPEGAKKGWEKRKGGGGSAPQWERGGRKPKRSPSDSAPPAKGRGPLKKGFVPGAFDPADAAALARRAAALTPEERQKIQRSKDRDLAARGISKSPQVTHGLRPAGELAGELKRLGVIPERRRQQSQAEGGPGSGPRPGGDKRRDEAWNDQARRSGAATKADRMQARKDAALYNKYRSGKISYRKYRGSEDEAGTPEGAKKGWVTRQGGGTPGSPAYKARVAAKGYDPADYRIGPGGKKVSPRYPVRKGGGRSKRASMTPDEKKAWDVQGRRSSAASKASMPHGWIRSRPDRPQDRKGVLGKMKTFKNESEDEAGTSDGAKKGWATRKGGGGSRLAPGRAPRASGYPTFTKITVPPSEGKPPSAADRVMDRITNIPSADKLRAERDQRAAFFNKRGTPGKTSEAAVFTVVRGQFLGFA